MALLFSGSRDQGLLALTIQEAARTGKMHLVGRTTLQKVMYFLKVMGVQTGYSFSIHHYGPFCDQILRDTELLLADDVICDRAPNPKFSAYVPGPEVDALIQHHPDLEEHRPLVKEVVSALVPLRPRRLELFATLDYSFRLERARGGEGPWKPRVIPVFHSFKGDRFSDDEISKAYDQLAKAGFVSE
jgi:uncharacterized protein